MPRTQIRQGPPRNGIDTLPSTLVSPADESSANAANPTASAVAVPDADQTLTLDVMEQLAEKNITVQVLYFAYARELTGGLSSETWTVSGAWTTSDLQVAVLARHGKLDGLMRTCAWALNEDYVDGPNALNDGDKLALIPPISGG